MKSALNPSAARPAEPVPGGRRRVALWIDQMNATLFEALRAEGVDVVAVMQASYPGAPSFSVHDLFYGGPAFASMPTMTAPAEWIDDASFREYARCVQRVGFYPMTDFVETLSGGVALGGDVEDWARLHLTRALQLLEGVRADEVWFCFNPHLGVDNMVALAARRTGRKCLVFTQIRFAPKFSWKQLGVERPTYPVAASWKPWSSGAVPPNLFYMLLAQPTKWDRTLAPRVLSLVGRLMHADWSAISFRLYQVARKRRWWAWMYIFELLDARTRGWAGHRRHFRRRFARVRLERSWLGAGTGQGPFVYFPLHLEPEENVHVLGGRFTNQLDAVVALHQAMPAGWTLVLKENPIQTYLNRGQPFDQRVAELPRLRFVDDAHPSAALIADAALVATITGTAGYEALIAGKPCVYFGEAWFEGLPGAVPFTPDLDLEALSKERVPREELDRAVDMMLSGLADGLAHPRYAVISGDAARIAELYAEAARSMVAISNAAESVVPGGRRAS